MDEGILSQTLVQGQQLPLQGQTLFQGLGNEAAALPTGNELIQPCHYRFGKCNGNLLRVKIWNLYSHLVLPL